MATTEEIKRFLEKRGIRAEVEQTSIRTFKITTEQVDATLSLLDSISEGSRFYVIHPDYAETKRELARASRPLWKKILRRD